LGIIILITDHLLHISFNSNYSTASSCRTWRYVRARLMFLTNFLLRLFFHSLNMGISVMSPAISSIYQFHVMDIYRPISEQL